mgnify:CR=1 FL=1
MTEREIKIIDESIEAYERMIKHFQKQICILSSKKIERCCFEEEKKIKFKVKHRERNAKKTKRYIGKRSSKN